MDTNTPLALLGGLTASQFMRRHWHKKPLLVRQAIPGFKPLIPRARLLAMAGEDGVESRLIQQLDGGAWKLSHGPLSRRSLPSLQKPGWTVLVQGVDLHDDGVHQLMQQFRFVPEARLQPDVPLKVLSHFEPEEEFVLEAGDMLYLPPKWAHDGIAEGECMTYSIGFRSPARDELAREMLLRMSDEPDEPEAPVVYRDPDQPAVEAPGEIPASLHDFARKALERALAEPLALERALGEYMTEPKANVWFEHGEESYLAGGRDATLMRKLADTRALSRADLAKASDDALELLSSWFDAGWVRGGPLS
jgi:50S ribosomal protein L16 3-hydroxylase